MQAAMPILPLLLVLTGAAPAPVLQAAPARTVMLTAFDRLRVTGPYAVEVVTGGRTGAELRGDRRDTEGVVVQVNSGVLTIRAAPTTRDGFAARGGPVTIRITTAAALQSVAATGGGRISVDRLGGPRVEALLTGSGTLTASSIAAEQLVGALVGTGTLTLGGTARQARLSSSGSGTLDAAGLDARELVVRSEGAGTGRFRARLTADVTANGAGNVEVEGTPKCQLRGTATIRCGAAR